MEGNYKEGSIMDEGCIGCKINGNLQGISCPFKREKREDICPCVECIVKTMCGQSCDESFKILHDFFVEELDKLKEIHGDFFEGVDEADLPETINHIYTTWLYGNGKISDLDNLMIWVESYKLKEKT
jgi:hypothetical protein